jgi:hypothetical protein
MTNDQGTGDRGRETNEIKRKRKIKNLGKVHPSRVERETF